jgi:16S rRNA processing protein RimM
MQRVVPTPVDRARDRHFPLKEEDAGAQAGDNATRVCLGVIAGVHGVKGMVRVKSFTAEPSAIVSYGPLSDEQGQRRFELELVAESKGVLLARIAGVTDRNAAERLKGVRLYVRRAALPEPEADEFYQADLLGLEARLADGTRLGKISAVHDFGAGASLEIEEPSGKTMIVPFTIAAVPEIDIKGGKIVVELPEELVDPPEQSEGA